MDIFRNARQNFLRRQAEAEQADIERQEARERVAARPTQQDMQRQGHDAPEQSQTARTSPVSAVLRRFAEMPRPSMPSFGRTAPRPTSSRYTESHADDEIVSPKTPQFDVGMPPMPSTRLHLPNLQRTWTRGSSGPPTRPGTATGVPLNSIAPIRPPADISEPVPVVPAQHVNSRNRSNSEESLGDDGSRRDRRRRRFEGADPAEMHLATMADDGRRRRRHGNEGSRSGRRQRRYVVEMVNGPPPSYPGQQPAKPKRFLYCFPYIKSRRMRAQILRCFVSGSVLLFMVAIFLALYLTSNIYNTEFMVLLLLIILFTSVFFAHGLVRLCMMVLHPLSPAEEVAYEERYRRRRGGPSGLPDMYGPGGYAIPHQPIRVTLARDEEAAGIESVTAKIQPPAYGLWRESVRVDPNRIYWQRNEDATASSNSSRTRDVSSNSSRSRGSGSGANMRGGAGSSEADSSEHDNNRDRTRGRQSPRPPSYVSEDGVQYVVEAQPRSIAPTTEIPLPQHPAEVGRIAPRPAW
ncbi:hypothetical protein SEUCBS139899_009191 [Sporothrix eucalyptigena]|uniref:Uncharacterized protein n=1 Tax=Sporothrix eucalyptigena TaxID=1812306 RepID=A0ABP0C0K2_9PEZI